ncbi:ATP-binding protein [Nocardia sp. NPDC048505]|uniref:ATP-binding protein n=1 Tax=unclassified Nocardia TaxID=2637762 RepID=UPI0033CB95CC
MTMYDPHTPDEISALDFDLDTTSDSEIRNAVRSLLVVETAALVNDAVLCTDEMVTNARRHGSPPRRCRILRRFNPERLRIEVDDAGAAAPRLRTPDDRGGRGILLLDRIALAWGVITGTGCKTVWAELALEPSILPAGA